MLFDFYAYYGYYGYYDYYSYLALFAFMAKFWISSICGLFCCSVKPIDCFTTISISAIICGFTHQLK